MATITTTPDSVRVELTTFEKIMSLRGSFEVPLAAVESARVSEAPFDELRGIRAPGLGWPRTVAIGRWRSREGTDFVVLRRGERAVMIDLAEGARYRRLVIGSSAPETVAAALG